MMPCTMMSLRQKAILLVQERSKVLTDLFPKCVVQDCSLPAVGSTFLSGLHMLRSYLVLRWRPLKKVDPISEHS